MRYIAQFHKGGFPEQYVVMEVISATERYQIGEPKPYHEANDEAEARNNGTWGVPQLGQALWGWAVKIPDAP